jgi:acyl transferase domain-containing protein
VSLAHTPLLDGHRVLGTMVFPAAAYVETVLAAAALAHDEPRRIAELLVHAPLVLGDDETRTLQLAFHGTGAEARFEIISRGAGNEWQTHVSGRLAPMQPAAPDGDALAAAQAACSEVVDVEQSYTRFDEMGMGYGPAFRGLAQLWRGEGAALGRVLLPQTESSTQTGAGFALHPALLDACLQVAGALLPAVWRD